MQLALIVEDDLSLAEAIEELLRRQGLSSIIVHRIQRALNLAEERDFSLAVLDRILPDGDGFDLIEPLIAHRVQTRVLVLSKEARTSDRIKGLKLGADDYLAKPFAQKELILKLKKLMAKRKIIKPETMFYKNIVLQPKTGLATVNKQEIQLRPKQAELLACLIQHQGLIVTHNILFDYIWGDQLEQPNDNSLAVYIRRLRVKLGRAGQQIENVRGIGYRLTNQVS